MEDPGEKRVGPAFCAVTEGSLLSSCTSPMPGTSSFASHPSPQPNFLLLLFSSEQGSGPGWNLGPLKILGLPKMPLTQRSYLTLNYGFVQTCTLRTNGVSTGGLLNPSLRDWGGHAWFKTSTFSFALWTTVFLPLLDFFFLLAYLSRLKYLTFFLLLFFFSPLAPAPCLSYIFIGLWS